MRQSVPNVPAGTARTWPPRTLLPPLEIPVGALTSLVGGPCLPWLLRRDRPNP
ncbi:hypothetical protein [Streptomyces sp. NPDC054962]